LIRIAGELAERVDGWLLPLCGAASADWLLSIQLHTAVTAMVFWTNFRKITGITGFSLGPPSFLYTRYSLLGSSGHQSILP